MQAAALGTNSRLDTVASSRRWGRRRRHDHFRVLQLFEAVLKAGNECFERGGIASVAGCLPGACSIRHQCVSCRRPSQKDPPAKPIALPGLLRSAGCGEYGLLYILEEVEMVEARPSQLSGKCLRVRIALLAAIRSRVPRRAGVGDEHPLMLGDRYQPLGGVLRRKLQLVAAGIEHDELGGGVGAVEQPQHIIKL
jgi:hypothetical protein